MAASYKADLVVKNEMTFRGIPVLATSATKFDGKFGAELVVYLAMQTEAKEGSKEKAPPVKIPEDLDKPLCGALSELVTRFEFTGGEAKSNSMRVPCKDCDGVIYVGVVGLGKQKRDGATIFSDLDCCKQEVKGITPHMASRIGGAIATVAKETKAKTLAIAACPNAVGPRALQTLIEAMTLALSPEDRFRSKPESPRAHLTAVKFLHIADACSTDYEAAMHRGLHFASGIQFSRELTNAPPNICNTVSLAKAATEVAKTGGMEIEVLGQEECEKLGMGSYLAVHRGSEFPPQFIHITYKGEGAPKKRIAYVGKGLCMDTGGYNLKVACGIEMMKMDMSGAAAVLGACKTLGVLKPKNVEVHFIVAAAENMISSKAYRPGDVLTASNGTTIEVGNTDAEGRLTLADALVFAEKTVKADCIVDLATLTGACMIGLGLKVAAVYGSDAKFLKDLLKSSEACGEPIWPMPLYCEYRRDIDSKVADLHNVSSTKYGGSITAGLFLKEFVEKAPWCHIDLAGPGFDHKDHTGTGYGVRTLIELAHALGK